MTARYAEKLASGSRVKTMLLGHLSENNNTPEAALEAVKKSAGEISVSVARQDCCSPVYTA
jgi:phosphoribosyl 1,2-cyclic phosphodiesterase